MSMIKGAIPVTRLSNISVARGVDPPENTRLGVPIQDTDVDSNWVRESPIATR